MFISIIGWLRGLSTVGRIVATTGTLATVGVVATAAQPLAQPAVQQIETANDSKVEVKVPIITTKEVVETEDVDFQKVTENTSSLAQGTTQLKQAGAKGIKTKTFKVTYTDGGQTDKSLIKEEVTTQPQSEITYVGTYVAPKYVAPKQAASCDSNYSGGCVPNVSYDLDCADIGFSVYVVGYDKHGFDRDNDGYGCESY